MDSYMGAGGYPRWGTHTVEVYLQWGEHKRTVTCEIGGNTLGRSIVEAALDLDNVELEMIAGDPCIALWDENGDSHWIPVDDIREAIIGVMITGWRAEEKKPKGAAPCDPTGHDKCYSGEVLASNPVQRPWICRVCLKEGRDVGKPDQPVKQRRLHEYELLQDRLAAKGEEQG